MIKVTNIRVNGEMIRKMAMQKFRIKRETKFIYIRVSLRITRDMVKVNTPQNNIYFRVSGVDHRINLMDMFRI